MSIEKPTEAEIKARDRTIRAERRKLAKLLEDLDDNKKKAAERLIDECAYIYATLRQLREYTDIEGLIDIMPQGSYSVKREHPASKMYNEKFTKFLAALSKLIDILPTKPALPEDDGFEDFRRSK